MKNMYIHMGQLLRPHGIGGEIVLDWYAVSPFSCQMPFWIQRASEDPSPVTITNVRTHHGRFLIRLNGVATRTDAEVRRNMKLLTVRSALPPLPTGEAYIADLIGAKVRLPNGQMIGHFSHVLANTSSAIWSIKTADNQEILFPAEPAFIQQLSAEEIIISPPEGLLELYLGDVE